MYGEYRVDMQGNKIFEGEYFTSEILNKAGNGRPPQLFQNHVNCQEEIDNMTKFRMKMLQIILSRQKQGCILSCLKQLRHFIWQLIRIIF